jgi:Protein of unknown function (DUF2934)
MATRRSDQTSAPGGTGARGTQPARAPGARGKSAGRAAVSPENRRAMIAQAAYLRAERRGFEPGQETEDWLAAEVEVDALLRSGHGPAQ